MKIDQFKILGVMLIIATIVMTTACDKTVKDSQSKLYNAELHKRELSKQKQETAPSSAIIYKTPKGKKGACILP